MLRIRHNHENRNIVRLRLDGSITDDTLNDLVAACAHLPNGGQTTTILDMAGVEYISNSAALKLMAMRAEHFRIINCSPFIDSMLGAMAEKG